MDMSEHVEVEIKIPLTREVYMDMDNRLRAIGAERLNQEVQTDAYYDHPSRHFQDTDEALRVRIRGPSVKDTPHDSTDLPSTELTYKGPKVDTITKTRVELTVRVDDADCMDRILTNLGFSHVATLTKRRVFYSVADVIVSLDDVENVGLFAEFENTVCNASAVPSARRHLFRLVERLGLDMSRSIRESYLELLLRRP